MTLASISSLLAARGNEVSKIHLGLHRIRAILRALGDPHRKYPALHVAGTNGKGSVAALSESILRSAGFRTGLFTSPHLVRINERILVGGREISSNALARVANRVLSLEKALLERGKLDCPLTYFEFITACAFEHFAEAKVEIAVVEVGLGGRLDATNVVRPKVCVITGISYDHQDILGNTLSLIAREKAGIIKRSVPVVSGCRALEAKRVIRRATSRIGARLIEMDRACVVESMHARSGRFAFRLRTRLRSYRNLKLSLAGKHQVRNAAMAILAIESMIPGGVRVGAVRRGLASVRWPGRLDEYRSRPRTVLDGAHNEEGARVLAEHIREFAPGEVHLVFGAMRDKDVRRIGQTLFPLARSIHLAPVANARSMDPVSIFSVHSRYQARMRLHRSARSALRSAWKECSKKAIVVVTGSLYLVGELLPLVKRAASPEKAPRQIYD